MTINPIQSAAMSGRQEGRLDLLLERAGATTRPVRCAVRPPLQLSRARYDNPARPDEPALTLVHLGGILAGDHYDLRIALGDDAGACVTTAAATQVYRMPQGEATQAIQLQLGCGEVYQFDRYAARLEAHDTAGRLLLAERALLEPRRHDLTAPGLLGATPVLGSLYILGDGVDAERDCSRVARRAGALSGLSIDVGTAVLPNGCGMLVRALGTAASQVHAALLKVWNVLAEC